ncbi:MAG: gliding motility protein GldC [Acidobacteria bacterium]|nr:gliding motility protein GldC [Acidobacteriota bacterium]
MTETPARRPRDREIKLVVRLDENNVPEEIRWQATDSPEPGPQAAEAFLLSLWDADSQTSLRIDLWTKKLQVDHMNAFVLQNLFTLADTFQNATGNEERAEEIRAFAGDLAARLELPPETGGSGT